MDSLTIFKTGFLLVISILRLVVAIPLFQTARRNNLSSLYWLGAQFVALVIAVPFAAAGAFDNRWIFWTFISLSEIFLILFIHTTFRRDRSSPMLVFLTLAIIGMIGGAYGTITNNFELSAWMVYPIAVIVWGWHLFEAFRSYTSIAREASTEDWVKSRYVLMISYSIVDFFGAILGTLLTAGVWISDIGSLIVVSLNVISASLQILTWVMPEGFRRWLNRNQQARTMDRIHEKAIAIFNILASALSEEGSGLSKMLAVFAIRKTIGTSLKTEDSVKIEEHAISMGYEAWLELLRNPEFYIMIKNSAPNINPRDAIARAEQSLVENQSLFTLQAR